MLFSRLSLFSYEKWSGFTSSSAENRPSATTDTQGVSDKAPSIGVNKYHVHTYTVIVILTKISCYFLQLE